MTRESAVLDPPVQVAPTGRRRRSPAPLVVPDGSLELLKWIGLLCMLADHINKYLLGAQHHGFFVAGRLALPLFAFVLGYNLARRPGIDGHWQRRRTMRRLAVFALAASLPYMVLGGLVMHWWPLNFMFGLLAAVVIVDLLQQPGRGLGFAACALFLVAGFFVEYWWPGIAAVIAAWHYAKRPTRARFLLWALTLSLLLVPVWFLQGGRFALNAWALCAIPMIFLARRFDFNLPRMRWLFYAAFPTQFAVLWLLRLVVG